MAKAKKKSEKGLSLSAKKRHVANAGTGGCPFCKADIDIIEFDELDPVEDGSIEQTASCPACKRRWRDVFRLVDVDELSS